MQVARISMGEYKSSDALDQFIGDYSKNFWEIFPNASSASTVRTGASSIINTTIYPDGDPEKLVVNGPFKYSRNPIYLGMFGIILAVPFLIESLSTLLIPFLFILILENTWIPYEEKKLKEKFNDEWDQYCAQTPKWLWK